jgi:hypothetical protein
MTWIREHRITENIESHSFAASSRIPTTGGTCYRWSDQSRAKALLHSPRDSSENGNQNTQTSVPIILFIGVRLLDL